MRCLALAQGWQDTGGRAVFIMAEGVDSFSERLTAEGMKVHHISAEPGRAEDAARTLDAAKSLNASWLIVDGYRFGSDYQKLIKDSGLRLMFMDDNGHCDHYYADIVLNQNLHADESMYSCRGAYTKLLLGTKYVLLRREFLQYRDWKREIQEVARKVLVTLGGGDPDNVTLEVINALRRADIDDLEAIVVVGADNPHYEELEEVASDCAFRIEFRRNVTYMPELMAWADIAVSAAGTTSWELAFMGLPSILLISADNQLMIAEVLADEGAAVNVGLQEGISVDGIAAALVRLSKSRSRRSALSGHGRRLVDGEGPARLCDILSV
jgi:UDP-2,4-diacetamido-2,4,6-trideoxy-beta-L-altropyranose hydrolase